MGQDVAETGSTSPGVIPAATHQWSFLSNHGHVLICLVRHPSARLREIAEWVGVTERAAHRLVADLREAGIVDVIREGRCNRYQVHLEAPLRHPLESSHTVGELVDRIAKDAEAEREAS